jgi:hypothetical protein
MYVIYQGREHIFLSRAGLLLHETRSVEGNNVNEA